MNFIFRWGENHSIEEGPEVNLFLADIFYNLFSTMHYIYSPYTSSEQ